MKTLEAIFILKKVNEKWVAGITLCGEQDLFEVDYMTCKGFDRQRALDEARVAALRAIDSAYKKIVCPPIIGNFMEAPEHTSEERT